ncbi:MAG: lamin tail domain-containing protein [Bacteroidales bacterium]|nr:lamin tail domain-containing protein [Bacteroidales bacterium]
MKKIFTLALAALTLFATSCVKDKVFGGATIDEVKNTVAYTANDAVKVTAKVSSLVPLKEVNLVWSTASRSAGTTVAMASEKGAWVGTIPAQPLETEVSYYVEAFTESSSVKSQIIKYVVGATPVNYKGLILSELNGNDKYIELFNKGSETIPLDGVYIEKDGSRNWPRETVPMPAGSVIAPGQFIVLYSSEKLDKIPAGWPEELLFDSGLSAGKAVRVQILDPSGANIDDFNLKDFKKAAPASYSRNADGKWYFAEGTPGAVNVEGTEAVEGLVGGDQPEEPEEPTTGSQIEAGQLFINECDATNKAFELYNATDSELDLANLKIVKDGTDEWVVPAEGFKIASKGFIVIPVKSDGTAGPIFGMSETKGFTLELISEKGSVHKADNSAKLDLTGKTWGLRTDGGVEWVVFSTGSMGDTNAKGVVEGEEGEAKIVLNEIDGNTKFIEIANTGSASGDMEGWTLEKDGQTVWTGPKGKIIAVDGHIAIYSKKASGVPVGAPMFDGGISAKKNVLIILKDPEGNVADTFQRGEEGAGWGEVTLPENTGASFSRVPDGTGDWAYATSTPGAANGGKTGEIEHCDGIVVLNEINGNDKYIELFNTGTMGSISLAGYTLYKDGGDEAIWTGGSGSRIIAGKQIVIYSNSASDIPDGAPVFTSGISAKKSVLIVLKDPDGNVADTFQRGQEGAGWGETKLPENTDASFSRVPDGTGDWAYAAPTCGAANGEKTGEIEQE